MKKYVFITGVSSGIGKAIAKELLENDYFVIGSVRNEKDAAELEKEYQNSFKKTILDITRDEDIENCSKEISTIINKNNLTALVNNSGIALGGPLMHQDINEIKQQFEINLFGLIKLTQKIFPYLKRKDGRTGKIINMSSTNGKIAYPFIGGYAATKHALEAISDSLRYELKLYGIKVVIIEPGTIKTAIWDKAEQIDLTKYEKTDYSKIVNEFRDGFVKLGKQGISPDNVAKITRKAIESKNPKTRYVVSGNKLSEWILPRILPDKIFDYLITKEVGIKEIKN